MEEKKRWQDWELEMDDKSSIWDPDGFRNQPPGILYTKEEFLERRAYCTMGPRLERKFYD